MWDKIKENLLLVNKLSSIIYHSFVLVFLGGQTSPKGLNLDPSEKFVRLFLISNRIRYLSTTTTLLV